MATIYKIELEVVSDWVNYTPEKLKELLLQTLENQEEVKLRVSEIKIDRK